MINRLIKILIELVNTPSDVIKSDLYTEIDDIIINNEVKLFINKLHSK